MIKISVSFAGCNFFTFVLEVASIYGYGVMEFVSHILMGHASCKQLAIAKLLIMS